MGNTWWYRFCACIYCSWCVAFKNVQKDCKVPEINRDQDNELNVSYASPNFFQVCTLLVYGRTFPKVPPRLPDTSVDSVLGNSGDSLQDLPNIPDKWQEQQNPKNLLRSNTLEEPSKHSGVSQRVDRRRVHSMTWLEDKKPEPTDGLGNRLSSKAY